MKKISFISLALILLIIMICSCSGKSGHSRKPFSTVELIPASKKYILGQSLTFNVKTKLKDGKIKTITLFLNDKLLYSCDKSEFTYTLSKLDRTGINTIRIVAETAEGISNTRIQNITVLSDILPVKYKYSIVNQFNHSADHFTQGLEMHNGYLYEGTGEYGKSAIFKINFVNNKVLQSKSLNEVFFGEGITILNEKIYQLTYKNQICFVYNLSDFAVADSFKFYSNEGWGLTNDGRYLIMSDGTGTLTWLDPRDFSIVKRIQATDNVKVYQYINELEYYKGTIWANVWTSDQIVRIDAESGKILGYLDLSNILSVMSGSKEKIDVLNGIAILPVSGNLLITGKLWPKMFEIKVDI